MFWSNLKTRVVFSILAIASSVASFAVTPIIENIDELPQEYLEHPLSRGNIKLTKEGQLVCVYMSCENELTLFFEGVRYKIPFPSKYIYVHKKGSMKISPYGEYIWALCTDARDDHIHLLRWKTGDIVRGESHLFNADFNFISKPSSLFIGDISYNGESIVIKNDSIRYFVSHDGKVFQFDSPTHPHSTNSFDTSFEISLRYFPYIEYVSSSKRCYYELFEGALRVAALFTASKESGINIGDYWQKMCEILNNNPDQKEKSKIFDWYSVLKEDLFKGSNCPREEVFLGGKGQYLVVTQAELRGKKSKENVPCKYTILSESDSAELIVSSMTFPVYYPLDAEGNLYVMGTRSRDLKDGDVSSEYHIICNKANTTRVVKLRRWLKSIKVLSADERVYHFAYAGSGEEIESGTYVCIVGKKRETGVSKREYRAIRLSFPSIIVPLKPTVEDKDVYCLPMGVYEDRTVGCQGSSLSFNYSFDSEEGYAARDHTWNAICESYKVGTGRGASISPEEGYFRELKKIGYLSTSLRNMDPQKEVGLLPIQGATSCAVYNMHPQFSDIPLIVGESTFKGGKTRACCWTLPKGEMPIWVTADDSSFPVAEVCNYSTAKGCCVGSSIIIGQYHVSGSRGNQYHACFWDPEGLHPLVPLKDHNYSDAFGAICKDEKIIIIGHSGILNPFTGHPQIRSWPVAWIDSKVVPLTKGVSSEEAEEAESSMNCEGIATCIARDGTIFGNYEGNYVIDYATNFNCKMLSEQGKAFICTNIEEGIQDLETYLRIHYKYMDTVLRDWELIYPTCVSGDGMIIAGLGRYRGQLTGFRLDLRKAIRIQK